jgi:hypothetical protein
MKWAGQAGHYRNGNSREEAGTMNGHAGRSFASLLLSSVILLCDGCGSTGLQPAPVKSTDRHETAGHFEVTDDTYGMRRPTLLVATDNELGLVLRAEVAESRLNIWFDTCVFRIDCAKGIIPGSYPLDIPPSLCSLSIFNCHASSMVKITSGYLSIKQTNGLFSGSFDVTFIDGDRPDSPAYRFAATFAVPIDNGNP